MSTSQPARKAKRQFSPRIVSLLIVLLVFAGVMVVQQMGWLQFLEFKVYDFLIRHQPKAKTSDPIVLVEMTEEDIHNPALDFPIHDGDLARLLRILVAAQPAAIGLDIWRDIPRPKDGSELAQLNEVLQAHENIVAIFTLGGTREGIAPPPILGFDVDRVAYNDNMRADENVDQTVPKSRRTTLFAQKLNPEGKSEGASFDAFPWLLARIYLERRGIEIQPDPRDPEVLRVGKARLRKFQANDGAYVRADTDGWQMLIDFKCPNQFTRFTFSQVLSNSVPAEMLKDKIVVIGMNSPSVSDERVTPISRSHRGPEVQSMIVNQLLREAIDGDKPLGFWADWLENTWTLVWCLAAGAIGYWARTPLRFALLAAFGLLALGSIVWQAFLSGVWIPFIAPAFGFVPATALVVSYVSFQERSMRNILMKLYSRHVSKEIAESTWANRESFLDGQRPLAQKLVVTVLFTDLKGFSTISEGMEPARLYEWLNGYLGTMAKVIQEHGGVLKQFTGDGILALFGVPLPHATKEEQAADAQRSVRCALAMGRRLVKLNRDWMNEDLPAVSMRAGIYTGEVAAGSIGSDDRFEYAVIGDVVNTASRLESYDKTLADPDLIPIRCRVLVGAPTYELLGDGFVTKEIGLLEVKGKAKKVAVFQVMDEVRKPTPPTTVPS